MANQDYQDWVRKVVVPVSFRSLTDTPGSFDGAAKKTIVVNDSETALVYSNLNLDDHSARHEEGGADEVTGITGKLNDHSTRHEEGAADEVTGITGKLNNHSTRHENGGADEISVAGLSGVLADKQDPQGHGSRHEDGGADPISTLGGNVSFPDRSFFRVSLTSDQSISGGVQAKLDFDTEDYDNRNEFDILNAWFQPAEAGYYLLGVSAYFGVIGTSDRLIVYMYVVDGSEFSGFREVPSNDWARAVHFTDIIYLSGAEQIAISVENVDNDDVIIGNPKASFFYGMRIA